MHAPASNAFATAATPAPTPPPTAPPSPAPTAMSEDVRECPIPTNSSQPPADSPTDTPDAATAPDAPSSVPPIQNPDSTEFVEVKSKIENDPGLSSPQLAAITLLLQAQPLGHIAQTLGISPRTLYRWRQDPAFNAELTRRRREIWEAADDRLRSLLAPAIAVLERHVHELYDRTSFRAAVAILRIARNRHRDLFPNTNEGEPARPGPD